MDVLVTIQVINPDAGSAQRLNLGGKFLPDFLCKPFVTLAHQASMGFLFAKKGSIRACDGFQTRAQGNAFCQVQMDAE